MFEFGWNEHILEKAYLKIWTKWEYEIYNENVVQEDDDGDITLNPAKGFNWIKWLIHTMSYFFFLIEHVINLFEKAKNLLSWKNVKSTWLLYLFLIFLLVSVTFFPIRYIIIIFLIWKFNRGRSYWEWVRRNNWEVGWIELTNFFIS